MEKFRTVLDFCLSHQKVLGYSAVSLLTAGSERLFSVVVFQCPCNSWNTLYGSVFLLVPALILFLLGYLLNVRTWRLFTGCCAPGRCCCCIHRRHCCRYLRVLRLVTVSVAVAPLTWVAVILLGPTSTSAQQVGAACCRGTCAKAEGPSAMSRWPEYPVVGLSSKGHRHL